KPAGNLVLDDDKPFNAVRVGTMPGSYYRLAMDVEGRLGHQPWWRQKGAGWQDPSRGSRYIWKLQSRRSLLIWKVYGQRMDGFSNDIHPFESEPGSGVLMYQGQVVQANDAESKRLLSKADVGYTGSIMPPAEAVAGTYIGPDGQKIKVAPLSDEDRRMLIRWIDLGCSIDLRFD